MAATTIPPRVRHSLWALLSGHPQFLVIVSVLLQFISVLVLAKAAQIGGWLGFALIFVSLGIGFLRLRYWAWVLNLHDLSVVYPGTALFYVVIYAYSVLIGESELAAVKVIGLALVVAGVATLKAER